MMDDLRQSYDAVPYESHPFAQSHPDRLATIGWIFGMNPTAVEHCRVLEVGCASGGNILPLAASLPDSQFVGVDFSTVQIERGIAEARALGLTNLRLEALDIRDLDASIGEFDYIIAHGVYSWVPSPVQQTLLEVIARHLSSNGIGYVSYNTLPGWSTRATVRAAMRYHTRHLREPQARVAQARAVLEFLAQCAQGDDIGYASMLRAEAAEVRTKDDYYVFHEHLEEVNEAFYFHEFVDRAAAHGLRYLGEATFRNMFTGDLAPSVNQALAHTAPDLITREQLIDFMRHRTFRQTLLVRDGVTLERKVLPLRVARLRAASRARPVHEQVSSNDAPEEFRAPDGHAIGVFAPICKAALILLAEQWPACLPFEELLAEAARHIGTVPGDRERGLLASALLSGFATGAMELHFAAPTFTLNPGHRPQAGALQRMQAERGRLLTTLRHEEVNVDPATQQLLRYLDGTRTRKEVAELAWPTFTAVERERLLDEALPQLARQALLVA